MRPQEIVFRLQSDASGACNERYNMKPTKNIRKEAAGWVVRIVRNGVEYSKYFRFSDGGVRASYKAAVEYRDKLLKRIGKRKWHSGPNRRRPVNNVSGVTGVSKNVYGRWVATWHENGKQHFKTFKLKREAVEFRKEQEERLLKKKRR